MNIEPLKKEIYERAKAAGITKITLSFSGGSDEGHLYVHCTNASGDQIITPLDVDIEDWVWSVYSYSGAGEGHDYGDDIVYDLQTKRASHDEWWMERTSGETNEDAFDIEGEEEEPTDTDEYPLTETAEIKIQMIRNEIASANNPERISALLTELEATLTK
jgi:hypothetical protein